MSSTHDKPAPDKKHVMRAKTDTKQNEQRRKALKTIGRFGLYTAPALVALLKSDRASAGS